MPIINNNNLFYIFLLLTTFIMTGCTTKNTMGYGYTSNEFENRGWITVKNDTTGENNVNDRITYESESSEFIKNFIYLNGRPDYYFTSDLWDVKYGYLGTGKIHTFLLGYGRDKVVKIEKYTDLKYNLPSHIYGEFENAEKNRLNTSNKKQEELDNQNEEKDISDGIKEFKNKNYKEAFVKFNSYPNNDESLYYLAVMYFNGFSVEKDNVKSYIYSKKSSKKGFEKAKKFHDILKTKVMSKSEIKIAEEKMLMINIDNIQINKPIIKIRKGQTKFEVLDMFKNQVFIQDKTKIKLKDGSIIYYNSYSGVTGWKNNGLLNTVDVKPEKTFSSYSSSSTMKEKIEHCKRNGGTWKFGANSEVICTGNYSKSYNKKTYTSSSSYNTKNRDEKIDACKNDGRGWKFDNYNNVVCTGYLSNSYSKSNSFSTSKGRTLFSKCSACHGRYGEKRALGKSEAISKWSSNRIYNALRGYKLGNYGGAMKGVMKGQVVRLSDNEMIAIAKYIESLN